MSWSRKLAVLFVAAGCFLALSALTRGRRLPAAPNQAAAPALSGDVNCDGQLNIGDPVHLLQYLFLGGPEPCVAQVGGDCCAALEAKLDRVIAALEDPCEDWLHRLEDNGDGTVTDHCTGLQWQQWPLRNDIDLDGVTDFTFNYNQAISLASLDRTGGFADWRLPTSTELEGLLQISQARPSLKGKLPELEISFQSSNTGILTATEVRNFPGEQGDRGILQLSTSLTSPEFHGNSRSEKFRVIFVRGPVE